MQNTENGNRRNFWDHAHTPVTTPPLVVVSFIVARDICLAFVAGSSATFRGMYHCHIRSVAMGLSCGPPDLLLQVFGMASVTPISRTSSRCTNFILMLISYCSISISCVRISWLSWARCVDVWLVSFGLEALVLYIANMDLIATMVFSSVYISL